MNLLDAIATKLGTSFDRAGRAHATCPNCGAEPTNRTGNAAYHFYLYDLRGKYGAVCWSCGYRPKLTELAEALAVTGYTPPAPRAYEPPPQAPWQMAGAVQKYRDYQNSRVRDVVAAWRQYKPLDSLTIKLADLGLGKLPLWDEQKHVWYQYRHDRLILPLFQDGDMVGMRARAIDVRDTGPKWLTASFSQSVLMGLEAIKPGQTVIWCENLVDRLLAAQIEPSVAYVASGGVNLQPAWLAALAAKRPAHVIVWFDNDLAGCPNSETMRLASARRKTEGKPPAPDARGPKLANELLQRGIRASVYTWPRGTPEHADLAWKLM